MKLIDLHCDTILRIYKNEGKLGLKENNLHVDLHKLKRANSMAQFFALFINMKDEYENGRKPLDECLGMLDRFYMELKMNSDKIAIATNYKEMENNIENGKISAFLAIEEGGALQGELSNLRNFYRLGVRLITLTWFYPNEIGYPNTPEHMLNGLTPFGREVVEMMNDLGMIIDVSHLSDKGFYDVASLSSQPFIASHSNSRAMMNHLRNLTDEMIKVLADKGGIMGMNFASIFLGESEISRVDDIVRHIKHIRNVGGIDVVAVGSDFDGISEPLEIGNIGEIDKLIDGLEKGGFTGDEIEQIIFKNAQRIIKEVMK